MAACRSLTHQQSHFSPVEAHLLRGKARNAAVIRNRLVQQQRSRNPKEVAKELRHRGTERHQMGVSFVASLICHRAAPRAPSAISLIFAIFA